MVRIADRHCAWCDLTDICTDCHIISARDFNPLRLSIFWIGNPSHPSMSNHHYYIIKYMIMMLCTPIDLFSWLQKQIIMTLFILILFSSCWLPYHSPPYPACSHSGWLAAGCSERKRFQKGPDSSDFFRIRVRQNTWLTVFYGVDHSFILRSRQ